MQSRAIFEVPGLLERHGIKRIYCLNYSLNRPIYTLSGGRLICEDLAWAPLSEGLIDHILAEAAADPGLAIVFRTVLSSGDGDRVANWLNRAPEVSRLLEANQRTGHLVTTRITDSRHTSFCFLSRRH